MSDKKISDLTLATPSVDSVVPCSNSSGTATNKVTLQSILDLETRWNLLKPSAPTNLSATAGNGQVSLSWTAPSSVIAVTDYIVQYSSNGGSSWTTFLDDTSSATIATVTGLINDTAYTFRVAAINDIGMGTYTSASSSVTPKSLPVTAGLQLWLDAASADSLYDATSGGSLVAANGAVARWEDKSGNARHFTQSNSGRRPLRKTSQQNGKDTLLFDGIDDVLIGNDFADYFQSGQSATLFVVMKTLSTGERHEIINKQNSQAGWRFLIESDNAATMFFDDYPYSRTTRAATSSTPFSSYSVLAIKASGGSLTTSATMYRNGSLITSSSSGSNQVVPDTSISVAIGAAFVDGNVYDTLNGNIAEVIIYNSALSDTDRQSVENYLMEKWAIPIPQRIADLQLWLDASDSSSLYDATSGGSLVAADGAVARWEDKSGKGRHATQGTSANRPVRKASQQNGKDTLLFDGTNDFLTSTDFIDLSSGQALTVFVVARRAATGSYHAMVAKADGTTGADFLGWGFRFTSANGMDFYAAQSGAETKSETASSVSASEYTLLAAKATAGALNTATVLYRNGSAISATLTGSTSTLSDSSYPVRIGAEFYQSTAYSLFNGNIAEICVYNAALSNTDRAAVESYLMTKWGLY